jgi:hypothetical protein
MKEKLKIGLLYLGLHNQLIKKHGVNCIITRKEFFCKLGKHYMIPKDLRHWIVNEMTDKNLIEVVNRDNIKILPCEIDIEKEPQKLYKFLNFLIV